MYTTTKPDRNRARNVVFYGRVFTEHEAQISALENQLQWYDDQARYHPNWNIIGKYIDMQTQDLIQMRRLENGENRGFSEL